MTGVTKEVAARREGRVETKVVMSVEAEIEAITRLVDTLKQVQDRDAMSRILGYINSRFGSIEKEDR